MAADESKAIRSRRRAPKTRTGCGTCKIRRVKCGEEKPRCLRCINFGAVCDGYGHLRRPAQSKADIQPRRPLLPKERSHLQMTKTPSSSPFRNEKEYRYFDTFCSETSYEILPTFNSSTLRQMLLQASQEEPSIRHAIIALGALDITTKRMHDLGSLAHTGVKEDHFRHKVDALEQYTIAIKHMQRAASSGRPESLLDCFLTLCFEAWSGNHTLAVMQIQTGLRIIHLRRRAALEARSRVFGSQAMSNSSVTEDELIRAFSGLDVYTLCEPRSLKNPIPGPILLEKDDERRSAVPNIFEQEERNVLSRMPRVFTSIQDAQLCRNALKLQIMRFLSTHAPLVPPRNEFLVNWWWGEVPSSTISIQQRLCADLLRWKTAFKPLWKKLKSEGPSTRLPAAILNLQIKAMVLALLVPFINDEASFDDYDKDFLDIIDLTNYVLKNGESTRHNFVLDTQVVIPLLVTGHKCRDITLRRSAISLMIKYPRREGVWDSLFCGMLAEWVMDLEERHLCEGRVPVWARIRGITVKRNGTGEVALECVQRTSGESDEVVTRSKPIRECGSR